MTQNASQTPPSPLNDTPISLENLQKEHQRMVLATDVSIHRCYTSEGTNKSAPCSHVDFIKDGRIYFSRLYGGDEAGFPAKGIGVIV